MGYLLKEALKTLCGVNQWSYAVFWKIGCQNPKLLIWEECYYEPASCFGVSGNANQNAVFKDYDASWVLDEASNLQSDFQAGDKVHLLVNKMMMDNHVNIVGEGLVGRVAFMGNHQWILSENYYGEAHPPEVLKEVCQQFSAGMRTVAVIPVLPHGVVKFGSCMRIMENMGFINDVTSLISQLGHVSGVLLPTNYEAKEHAPRIGVPMGNFARGGSSLESNGVHAPLSFDSFNYVGNSGKNPMNVGQTSFSLPEEILNGQQSNVSRTPFISSLSNQLMSGVAKAEVILLNSEMWKNQQTSLYNPSLDTQDIPPSFSSMLNCNQGHFSNPNVSSSIPMPELETSAVSGEPKNTKFHKMESANSDSVVRFTMDPLLAGNFGQSEMNACKKEMSKNVIQAHTTIPLPQYNEHLNMAELAPIFAQDDSKQKVEARVQESGDDLFDVLGPDFRNKLFNSCWNSLSNESPQNMHNWDSNSNNNNNMPSRKKLELDSVSQENSDSGIFLSAGSDHLLDAVVSKVRSSTKPSIDDTVSCRTTLANTSSSSVPNASLPCGRFGGSDQLKGELFGVPEYVKAVGMSSCSVGTGISNEESRTYSQGNSIYESQISTWIENDQRAKANNSVSTGHLKKQDGMGKTNRKRLKPGENPRPRPKDRQMIQDRVKELREIVPNGAKCSIDALLECTIKHMLFLQSVTKHADKLKQTGESKIMSKDGGLLLRDDFEGGATWAYEIGSQSMVCPIRVEDLNQPRQMLVEMLCEERGLFLEIADIIRGQGLTILKGVMENRNDKIWARFAVEANRDVTRMEIFISLVRLLEQSTQCGGSQPNGNITAQQFNQFAPIPRTH